MSQILSHRQMCRLVCAWMQQRGIAFLTAWELSLAMGVCDSIGISSPGTLPELKAYADWRSGVNLKRARAGKRNTGAWSDTRPAEPEIRIAEVKVTRADLLADLRAQKMLAYEDLATHCYLALGPDLVAWYAKRAKVDLHMEPNLWARFIREDLSERGLPKHWGILVVQPAPPSRFITDRLPYLEPYTIRGARRCAERPPELVRYIGWRMAKSMMHRVLGPSPLDVLQKDTPTPRTDDADRDTTP